MLYLIGSIICTSWLTLSFKLLGRLGISNVQAIVINYWSCVFTGWLVKGGAVFEQPVLGSGWLPWGTIMGISFFLIFNIIAQTTQKFNVAVSSVSNKLSLVIPFLFSLYLYSEPVSFLKILGILIALIAVVLTCLPKSIDINHKETRRPGYLYFYPLVLFLSSGLLDTLIKYVEQTHLQESANDLYLTYSFGIAALTGLVTMIILMWKGKEKFDWRSIPAGILIGVPNYFSIWFLLRVLKAYTGHSSQIIPINNMGIVLFSTLAALFLFRERLSWLNWIGILLSILAIALIAYG